MSTSGERKREDQEKWPMMSTKQFDTFFDNFRKEMEKMMTQSWSYPTDWEIPHMLQSRDMRIALYEMVDKGDRLEVQLELPGIEKENVEIKASKYSVEISGKHSEKSEEKRKKYVYSERMFRSFYRVVPLPEEIIPSRVSAKVENGMLKLELPKKNPTEGESQSTRVQVQ